MVILGHIYHIRNDADTLLTPTREMYVLTPSHEFLTRVGVGRFKSLKCISGTSLFTFLVKPTNILVHVFEMFAFCCPFSNKFPS